MAQAEYFSDDDLLQFLDQNRHIHYVQGQNGLIYIKQSIDLHTSGKPVHLEMLGGVNGNIAVAGVPSVNLPNLQICQELLVEYTPSLSIPALKECRTIFAPDVEKLEAPVLEKAYEIDVTNAESVHAPSLKKFGLLVASAANTVHIPAIEEYMHGFTVSPEVRPALEAQLAGKKMEPPPFSEWNDPDDFEVNTDPLNSSVIRLIRAPLPV